MDDKTLAGLIHLLNVFGLGIVSIILWAVKKDESEFIDAHGKAFLNYFITLFIASCIAGILTFILIGILVFVAIGIYALVFGIMGAIKGFNGEAFVYPMVPTFIK
jgi:uncharacterized Tic20 family protein